LTKSRRISSIASSIRDEQLFPPTIGFPSNRLNSWAVAIVMKSGPIPFIGRVVSYLGGIHPGSKLCRKNVSK